MTAVEKYSFLHSCRVKEKSVTDIKIKTSTNANFNLRVGQAIEYWLNNQF
jgi:hypothetical protein